MIILSPIWLEILSDLFVNLSAGWLAVAFIEPQINSTRNISLLLFKLILAIVSLIIAKSLREEAKKYA